MLYDLKFTEHSQKYEGQSHLQTLLVDKGRLCKKKLNKRKGALLTRNFKFYEGHLSRCTDIVLMD